MVANRIIVSCPFSELTSLLMRFEGVLLAPPELHLPQMCDCTYIWHELGVTVFWIECQTLKI